MANHVCILQALQNIPFSVGKKYLVDFLQGISTDSIVRCKLYKYPQFGSLAYTSSEIMQMIDGLIQQHYIQLVSLSYNKYSKVLAITQKGIKEIQNPSWHLKGKVIQLQGELVSSEEKKYFLQFTELERYDEYQKKAILLDADHILCIAGAGSGKTSVLTERIAHLCIHKNVKPEEVLALTFTKKARLEMKKRINNLPVHIHTFNSFCESIIQKYESKMYTKSMKIISYSDKIIIVKKALKFFNLSIDSATQTYYGTQTQKSSEELFFGLVNDCFSVSDYMKFKQQEITEFEFDKLTQKDKPKGELVFGILRYIRAYMKKYHLRDFSDQLIDVITFFENNPGLIPSFKHILIDEFQDVNEIQMKLVEILCPKKIFCVGDPRQAIYGWRGSDIKFIQEFPNRYQGARVICLKYNYRSHKHIVNITNSCIDNMGLETVIAKKTEKGLVSLLKHQTQEEEFSFIIKHLQHLNCALHEVFILARTHKTLEEFAKILEAESIPFYIRGDNTQNDIITDAVVLSTVHGIKGLEAEVVFVLQCTNIHFPIKVSEHPVTEFIKIDSYDKEEEERRLLYVALSRAKKGLFILYTGKNPSYFITPQMKKVCST